MFDLLSITKLGEEHAALLAPNVAPLGYFCCFAPAFGFESHGCGG